MPTKEEITKHLEKVVDPEMGVNIMDLGLVYEINIIDEKKLDIKMTMTSPFCPVAPQIMNNVKMVLHEAGFESDVELVWSPAWTPERMTEKGKFELGLI